MPTAWLAKTWAKLISFVAQTEAAATGGDNDLVVKGIVDIGQSLIGSGERVDSLGRALHSRAG